MKKLIFTLSFCLLLHLSYTQTTYYWVGGAAPSGTSFNTSTLWNTAVGGGGTARTTALATDILIFDGSDISDAAGIQTGPIVFSFTSPTASTGPAQLKIVGADVTFKRAGTGGTTTLTVGAGNTLDNDPDFVVGAGSKFTIAGTTGSFVLSVDVNATAEVGGDVVLAEGTSTVQNRLTARTTGAFHFLSGSSLRTLSTYAYYPFSTTGSSLVPAAEGVVFETGSQYFYEGGLSPFGSNSTSFLVKFMPGSKFYFRAAPAANMFGSRKYADVVVENNATVTANGSLIGIDSFRVESGATYITNTSGVTPISGNVIINGTFKVPDANPDRENRIIMIGSAEQTVSGTGTFSLADFIISDVSTVKLQKNIVIDSITRVIGDLNPNGFGITGAGTISEKAPASINITGNINTDSFIVKNVSDFTGIETGMSVSGSNIAPNTVVTNTSSSSGTITLSKAVTGSVTYAGSAVNLTVFNGQGQVLPVKLGAISAVLLSGKTLIKWEVFTEQNIAAYSVERSATANQFTSITTVTANNSKQYSYTDASPLTGVNYYRIKVVSRDGNVQYSSILKVNNGKGKQEFAIYPNPVQNKQLNVNLSGLVKDEYSITVYNTLGQPVLSRSLGTLNGSINTMVQLPATIQTGVYKVIITSKEQKLVHSILIQ